MARPWLMVLISIMMTRALLRRHESLCKHYAGETKIILVITEKSLPRGFSGLDDLAVVFHYNKSCLGSYLK